MHTKCMGPDDMISSLSGGNQQKVIFGKWLEREPQVFMMDEPTRGIDVGAKYEIYELIINMAKQGKTIIVVSSEMPEILNRNLSCASQLRIMLVRYRVRSTASERTAQTEQSLFRIRLTQ